MIAERIGEISSDTLESGVRPEVSNGFDIHPTSIAGPVVHGNNSDVEQYYYQIITDPRKGASPISNQQVEQFAPTNDAEREKDDEARRIRNLVEKAKAGETEAFGEIYSGFFPRVYRYILVRTGNVQDAQDLAQEVFMKALDSIERFQLREVPFAAWLFRIAHNTVISARRKNNGGGGTLRLPPEIEDKIRFEEEVENKLLAREFLSAALRLPAAQRQVIQLRFATGLSVAETAKIKGTSENSVKSAQYKAIAALRRMTTPEPKYFLSKKELREIRIVAGPRESEDKKARGDSAENRLIKKLVSLRADEFANSNDLAEELAVTAEYIRRLVVKYRKNGVPIKTKLGRGYYIEIKDKPMVETQYSEVIAR